MREVSLMVKGQPRGSTSYAPGFPATVVMVVLAAVVAPGAATPELATTPAPPAVVPAGVARQPYLQWMKSSPICSATAMLLTTTVSLAVSTGHLSGGEDTQVTRCLKREAYFQDRRRTWFILNVAPVIDHSIS